MIQAAEREFSTNFKQAEAIASNNTRFSEEDFRLHQLIHKNDEILRSLELELADSNPAQKTKLKPMFDKMQNQHREMSKKCLNRLSGHKMDPTLDKNSRSANIEKIKMHEEKMATLNEAKRNLGEANQNAGGVQLQLEKDFEALAQQKETIKLLGEDLLISKDMMAKIKVQNSKSLIIFMIALCVPAISLLLAIFVKIYRTAKAVTSSG